VIGLTTEYRCSDAFPSALLKSKTFNRRQFRFVSHHFQVLGKVGPTNHFYVFAGNFKKANLIFAQPVLFFPAIYSFAMWHAYNYEIIAGNGSKREYKLTGFFFGFTIGGVPGMSHRFLGTHIFTGLATGVVMGIIFHLLEKGVV
jgi:hypothetical protein